MPSSHDHDLAARDQRHLWHPFTQMRDWLDGEPLVIERGAGNYLYDTEGRRYFDGVSSLWVNLHGHDHPLMRKRIGEQMERFAHSTLLGLSNAPAVELAEKLAALAPPGLTRVFYSDNGSTAVEVALKLAFQYWLQRGEPQRTRFVAFRDGYHGDTLGAVSVGGIDAFHNIFRPLCFPALLADNRDPEHLAAILRTRGDTVAAVCIEPLLQAAGGMKLFPKGFLARVRELCDAHGILLIADEVATGFGRTGTLFACEQEGVVPDFLALAKSLTAGWLPLGATLTRESIFEQFLGATESGRHFSHGHSYAGNALCCAAALANLEIFATENVLERTRRNAAALAEGLAGLRSLNTVGEIRQLGLIAGVDLVDAEAAQPGSGPRRGLAQRTCLALRRRGIILRPLGNTLVVMPPLSTTTEEIGHLAAALRQSIVEADGGEDDGGEG